MNAETMAASIKLSTTSTVLSIPSSSRKYIDEIPADKRSQLCTEIDYTIHRNEGYWQKLIGRLGFDETRSKKFRLSFEMHGSPTDNLLRDCSYRMLRIRHLYQILTEIGLPNLAEAYLKDYDTEEPLPPMPIPFSMTTKSTSQFKSFNNGVGFENIKDSSWAGINTHHVSFDEIREGTLNFSPQMELGAGAFGKVYKVMLNNTLFACKLLKIDKENQLTTSLIETHRQHDDLRNELNYLAEYRHPNVIALYGWSLDGPDPCLIYDYMKNGSLQDRLQCLNSTKPMDWDTRVKVSCGAARGLQYLHTKNSKPLIHGDIKTANILLDNSFTAKLGDFGLAREMPHNTATGSYIRLGNEHTPGTLGYLANEYILTKKLSVQVDTYAFGVVLLELYTGRRAFDRTKETPLLRDYMDDVASDSTKIGQAKTNQKLFRLQDPRIESLYEEAALKFVQLALACCHEKRKGRPRMADTLRELNEIERMVAVAHGREPEESMPAIDAKSNLPVDGADVHGTNTLQRRKWLIQHNFKLSAAESDLPNLSKDPVESVDNSLVVADQLVGKLEKKQNQLSKPPIALNKRMDQLNFHDHSSSDDSDSQGRYSAETTNSGLYYVQRPDQLPNLYPSGHPNNPPQRSYYPSSFISSSVSPHAMPPFMPHGYVAGVNKVRVNDGPDIMFPGPSCCSAGRGIVENPYNLDLSKVDLSKVPRPPCSCGASCTQGQPQNISPSQTQWPGPVDCSPEIFSSIDYKAPSTHSKYSSYYSSKFSTNGDVSSNAYPCNRGVNPKFPMREPTDFQEISVDGCLPNPTQANSFSFPHSYLPGHSDVDESEVLHMPPLSINPVKESLLEGLKEGQSYTQIFSDKRRTPTEGSSEGF